MDLAQSFGSSVSEEILSMQSGVTAVPGSFVLLNIVKQEPSSDTESTERGLAAEGDGGCEDSLWEMSGMSEIQPEPSHVFITSQGTSGTHGGRTSGCEWSGPDSELLLNLYAAYSVQIGPLKKFRNKKAMFEKIASDLQEKLGVTRTGEQCCTRYKTILKRKRAPVKENGKSVDSSELVPCDEEPERIKWPDNSLGLEIVSFTSSIDSEKPCAYSSGSELSEKTDPASLLREEASDSEQDKELRTEKRKYRASTARMKDMRFFFEKLKEIEDRKAKRQAKRDAKREKRWALKLQRREEMHREKMDLLRKAFGLNEEQV